MTLFSIYKRYKWRISLTMLLVLAEAIAFLLFPLVIGFAIDGLLEKSYIGIWQLAALGFALTIAGSIRRLYDTRVYAGIHVELCGEVIDSDKKSDTSTLNARVSMLEELTEFFENSFPDLMNSLIGLVGTVIVLYTLDFEIFLGCLIVLLLMLLIFWLTKNRTQTLNHYYNNELEKQVVMIENRKKHSLQNFMKGLMRWQIKLSDLETLIFGIIWLGMVALIVFSVIEAVGSGTLKTGAIMAIVMYVFQFAEGSGMLPVYFQQFLRLQEISERLNTLPNTKD